jgi:hypothetical protein
MPQAAAVNFAEDDVRIKVVRARLRKPLVVAQEPARRFDETITQLIPRLHRVRCFYGSLTSILTSSSVFFGLKTN